MSITPKDWDTFQHYKDRKPAWIKLHRAILDDFDFHRLPVGSRALAPMMWLLASEYDKGKITATTEEIAFRFRMPEADLKAALEPLFVKFFVRDTKPLAARKPESMPEREGEIEIQEQTETEQRPPAAATTKLNGATKTNELPLDQPKQAKPPKEKKQATRITEDWKLSQKNTDDARAAGLTEVEMALEARKFRNYWMAKSGKDAAKLDWDRTWDNWCIEAARRLGRSPSMLPAREMVPARPVRSVADWQQVLRVYGITSNWPQGCGPAPGQPGCLVPPDLLKGPPEDEPA